jgi:hypothetical protein
MLMTKKKKKMIKSTIMIIYRFMTVWFIILLLCWTMFTADTYFST